MLKKLLGRFAARMTKSGFDNASSLVDCATLITDELKRVDNEARREVYPGKRWMR